MLTVGCNTKVSEGMVVHTLSPKAKAAQKSALEFLLLDHPLDCPVCDKAGECKLQNQYMEYGLYDFRRGVPRDFKGGKDLDIGEHIILDQERCVLCTRCIRFVDEVPKNIGAGHCDRGHESTISIFPGRRLDNAYSGNVTDICPVGALTLKEFRFKQRFGSSKKPSPSAMAARGAATLRWNTTMEKFSASCPGHSELNKAGSAMRAGSPSTITDESGDGSETRQKTPRWPRGWLN